MSILTKKQYQEKSFSGIGIHTKAVNIIFYQPPGIIFKRIDLKNNNIIYPLYNNVINTVLCTTVSNEHDVKFQQLNILWEHLWFWY